MTSASYFRIAASPLWLFGILLASILIFHIAFLVLWAFEKLGWKVIDYIWLSVAALGLFSAAGEVRRLRAEHLVEERRISAAANYGRFLDEVKLLTSPAMCRNLSQSESISDREAEYDDLCKYGHDLQAIFPLTPPQDLAKIEWPDRPSVADPALKMVFSSLVGSWQEYLISDAALGKAIEETEGIPDSRRLQDEVENVSPHKRVPAPEDLLPPQEATRGSTRIVEE